MPIFTVSLDTFIATSLAIIPPTIWLIHKKGQDSPHRTPLNILIILHTLFILYTLTLRYPSNLFQSLRLPLTTPSDSIRNLLIDNTASLPRPLESLLHRLSSFEVRTFYVRFGQSVLQDCEHCSTFDEYALYALPNPLLTYIRESIIIGIITITGSFREKWRSYALSALLSIAVLEAYLTVTTTIKIPRDGLATFMLHDTLWTLRHILFLLLPLTIHSLPPSPPQNPSSTLTTMHHHLQTTLARLTSLKYLRAALMRDPYLREAALGWWDGQRRSGKWVREDEAVGRLADKMGYGYDHHQSEQGEREEGKLRTNARIAVSAVKASFEPAHAA